MQICESGSISLDGQSLAQLWPSDRPGHGGGRGGSRSRSLRIKRVEYEVNDHGILMELRYASDVETASDTATEPACS